jgi:hypothetical protein
VGATGPGFEGILKAQSDTVGALHGTFVGGTTPTQVPNAVMGQFSLSGSGNYTAAGTFGAEKKGP